MPSRGILTPAMASACGCPILLIPPPKLTLRPPQLRLAITTKTSTRWSANLRTRCNSHVSPPPSDENSPWLHRGRNAVLAAGLVVLLGIGGYILIRSLGKAGLSTRLGVVATPSDVSSVTVTVFGRNVTLGERTPGWVYFLLLMAAGFGLFVSEEALNVWVGACLGRCLTLDGTRVSLLASLTENLPFIASTIFWVYWGVCISDMVPFFAGKLAAQSKGSDQLRQKLGIDNEKLENVRRTVQRYGDFIGFVERFSIGARNPTSFLAGASGVAPSKYFAGVCLGCLLTLPIQLGIGLLFRKRPVTALAGVAAFVGVWTLFPYIAAVLVSLFYFRRDRSSSTAPSEFKAE